MASSSVIPNFDKSSWMPESSIAVLLGLPGNGAWTEESTSDDFFFFFFLFFFFFAVAASAAGDGVAAVGRMGTFFSLLLFCCERS